MMPEHSPRHSPSRWPKERIVVHSWDEVPEFANGCEEHEFWSTHAMGDEFFEYVGPDARAESSPPRARPAHRSGDRKSTRLNSSHANISYAVFCLKKKRLL